MWGYDIAGEHPVVDEAAAVQIVRNLLGMPDLEVEITGTSLWGNNEMYATRRSRDGCSARATRSTGTRRATAWGPTPPSRTPTTSPGRSRPYSRDRRNLPCWRPIPPNGPPSPNGSSDAPTGPAASSSTSSKRWAFWGPRTRPR
ncbi:hypothetical protein [Streptomyces bobili]